ncbi:TonB-dependent siderophore receptor [Lelliottia amnigena]|nr:TonB-dependent siderophore receptor [Lelliottia amnigena]
MKIISARQATLSLLWAPIVLAPQSRSPHKEQTMIVSATPQTVSELDTPAAISVVNGDDMRQAAPRINLSESLGSVPGLQIQNRQNYAQDLQLSMRGFGARSTFGRARHPHVCRRHSGHYGLTARGRRLISIFPALRASKSCAVRFRRCTETPRAA